MIKFKSSHRPDGKIADVLVLTHACTTVRTLRGQLQGVRDTETFQSSQRPKLGNSRFARRLQGGGVFVQGGTVSIVNSQFHSNTASQVYVPATPANFPSPRWENY